MGKYQKNIEAARRISVMQYLETYHPGELVRKTDKEYCTKAHSSLVITPSNGLCLGGTVVECNGSRACFYSDG